MLYFKLNGGDDLAKTLTGISARVAKDAALKSVISAVQPIVKGAKQNVAKHRRTGDLERAIGFFVRKYHRGRRTYAVIGARRGMGIGKNEPANYAHLLENGYVNKKTGKRVAAKPYLRPAFDRHAPNAMQQMAAVFSQELKMAAMICRRRAVKRPRNRGIKVI
ncbi:MAG: HK97 gp10 family phage protein [Opitutaceae bacterium]|jgi:hypothetical protein